MDTNSTDGNELLKTAIVYDFDGTLARGNLQECSFIPDTGMSRQAFWDEVKARKKSEDADEILVYMHLMLEKAKEAGQQVTREMLRAHGRDPKFFPGLADMSWFTRINGFAREHGLKLQHFIVSSGIEEMIRGCVIESAFEEIFASKYIYENNVAVWPGVGINYTTKTQYLFRINKGISNHWDNDAINKFMHEEDRPVPFSRMIFLGDGETDIPTMKQLSVSGGYSIAVYDEQRGQRDLDKIHNLISEDRVNFVAPGNYEENSQLDIIVKGILGRIARTCPLR